LLFIYVLSRANLLSMFLYFMYCQCSVKSFVSGATETRSS